MGYILLTDLFKIILKRLHVILIVAVLCGAISVACCMFVVDPVYSAKSSLFTDNGGITAVADNTSNGDSTVKSTDVASSLNLLSTYVGLLDETDFYNIINNRLRQKNQSIGLTDAELKSMVSLTGRKDTMLLDITVRSKNGQFAVDLANAIAEEAPEYIKEFVPQASAKKFRTAKSYTKVSPNITITSIAAAFLGAVVCAALIVIRALNDQTVKGEDDFAEKYDVPILGSIPNFNIEKSSKGKGGYING